MDELTDGRNGQSDGRTDGKTDGRTDVRTDVRTDGQTDGRTDGGKSIGPTSKVGGSKNWKNYEHVAKISFLNFLENGSKDGDEFKIYGKFPFGHVS